jgi:hypothetical protein
MKPKVESNSDLKLKVKNGVEQTAILNFNRFRYIGVPKSRQLDNENLIVANRDNQVRSWYVAFSNANDYSDVTLFGYFNDLSFYIALIDTNDFKPDSKEAVDLLEVTLVDHVRLGKHSIGWARKMHSGIRSIFHIFGWETRGYFSDYPLFKREFMPTPAYSDSELKTILKLLNSLFFQLESHISQNLNMHLSAGSRKKTVTLKYDVHTVSASGAINKYFSIGYFLMSYYTWANMTSLLKLKRPKKNQTDSGDWYSESVEKKRARKFVTVELGDNNSTLVPSHSLKTIESIIGMSLKVAPDINRLFHVSINGQIKALEANYLTQFTNWLIKNFALKGDNDWPLRLQAQRFRVTGSNKYLDLTNDSLSTSLLLNNTPDVLRKHYSTGNEGDNERQLQAVSRVLEGAAKCKNVEEAIENTKEAMDVEILPYDAFINRFTGIGKPEKTVIGTGCKNSFSGKAEKYNKKHKQLIKQEGTLACADILKCFGCENQVIIEEVDDIWCLLSFKEALIEASHEHANAQHFRKNFSGLLNSLERACFRVSPKIRRKAESKLSHGRHPLWETGLNLEY